MKSRGLGDVYKRQAPDMDGGAEPGEVVWVTVPSQPPRERSMLVVGREYRDVLGLLISPEEQHADDDRWFEIGPGDWDASGSPCWVRLDKTLVVPEADVHRRGTTVPQRRFERVANTLRCLLYTSDAADDLLTV